MSSFLDLTCFKTYDIRGKLGEELDENIAYKIGQAVVQSLGAKSIVIGFDARATSSSLAKSVAAGVNVSGCDVIAVGPFSNFICEVQNIEENQRVWVLIEILQRKIHTKIALKDISKLP